MYKVLLYWIERDEARRYTFDDKAQAEEFAASCRKVLLESKNPAAVTIDMVPA